MTNDKNENLEEISRVILPNSNKGEMFGIVEKLLGSSRLVVMCADGKTRTGRIPGKIRKRMWMREGDLVIAKPWSFQDERADVTFRYTKTQAAYLSRNKILPEILDVFK
ncbi:MAG: translation initiation factor eIF-1A [Candidatus Thermoplasmatota archaeon]|jgi:translation initiation factor 1A|nr:translation initiation factor eIF-1A [Candidatus Thermoplasmatota archaeon]